MLMGYHEKIQTAYLSQPAMKPNLRRRVPQRIIYVAASLLLIFLFYITHHSTSSTSHPREPTISRPNPEKNPKNKDTSKSSSSSKVESLPCRSLPGADDVVVILKTGSTEIQDKLPVHLNTTLRCYPNYLLFSDYEETFRGEHIIDALEFTTPSVRENNADFELWRRLQKGGRSALKPSELSGPISRPNSATGKPDNPGWKLDKWKFMPMVNRTLMEYPNKKWYVFVETDTYIFWQTLLNYLSAADWKKPYYMGGQIWIGDIQFAHGGTGFAISRPALESVVKMFQDRQEEWESFTNGHWAGDCVLGKAMKDSGTPMTMAWPIWQGDDIGNMNFGRVDGHRLWCYPSVSYHHLGPTVIQDLWDFEQEWIADVKNPKTSMHHYDMYRQYILPQIQTPRKDWFNHADEDRGPVENLEACHEVCEKDGGCLQYSLTTDNRCMTTTRPNLGEWYKGIESGWMPGRMKKWADKMEKCKEGNWLT